MSTRLLTAGRWVVGTDGSEHFDKAVMWAAKYASQRTVPVPLLIVHAIPESPFPSEAEQNVLNDLTGHKDATRRHADSVVAAVADRVRAEYPDLLVETAVVRGSLADILSEAGTDADQVVVSSVNAHVIADAQGSIAVVPDRAEPRPLGAPVVLALDDTPEGRLAMARAFQAASLRRAPLTVVRARGEGVGDVEAEARRLIAGMVAEFPDVAVSVETPSGRLQDSLIAASKSSGLIVLGSKGRTGFTGLRLDPVARELLDASESPVVVARSEAGWIDRRGRREPAAH